VIDARKKRRFFSLSPFFILLGAALVLVLSLIYLFSDRLIFLPHKSSYNDTDEILKLATRDGAKISAIYLPNPNARFTILFSHGNGEDLGDDLPSLHEYQRQGFSILAYDYHGYGTSSGRPSEQNAYADIDAGYEYLTQNLRVPAARIIAHGRSLGAAVAIDLAARKPMAALIVESGFVSAFRVRTGWAIFPFDKFRSIDKIASVQCPIFVIHGTGDSIIHQWHGRELLERAHEPKFSYFVERGGHNDLSEIAGAEYWNRIDAFARFVAEKQ
jgi:fermentation-respiration switch protein FrsA (DUF1100 family)